jgi:hypothetical protein
MSEATALEASRFERTAEVIDLKRATQRGLREEAAFRRMSATRLTEQLLDRIVEGDLFPMVLGKR